MNGKATKKNLKPAQDVKEDSITHTKMKQTSLLAYKGEPNKRRMANQRLQLLALFKRFPNYSFTRQTITEVLNWKINVVCGRVNELLKQGLIYENGKCRNKYTGKLNNILSSVP